MGNIRSNIWERYGDGTPLAFFVYTVSRILRFIFLKIYAYNALIISKPCSFAQISTVLCRKSCQSARILRVLIERFSVLYKLT